MPIPIRTARYIRSRLRKKAKWSQSKTQPACSIWVEKFGDVLQPVDGVNEEDLELQEILAQIKAQEESERLAKRLQEEYDKSDTNHWVGWRIIRD
jgi:hypothetical protein